METEVLMPSPPVDCNFDSACNSPYITAPSSPQRLGNNFFVFSAPTSPTRASAFYREFNSFRPGMGGDDDDNGGSPSAIPFNWEEKPGTPKANETKKYGSESEDMEFAFDFSGQLERNSLTAEELFDGGKIKPLKPPPRLQYPEGTKASIESPRSTKMLIKEALSPRQRRKEFDPFEAAIEQTRKGNTKYRSYDHQRGRERTPSCRRKGSRSLSPFRVSDILFEQENNHQKQKNPALSSSTSSVSSSTTASFSFSNWYKKWNLKDILLFRSASEGRAATTEPNLNKYSMMKKSNQEREDVKNSSFRSTESVGSSSSLGRRGQTVSAHELHYTAKSAAAEEMRKKTFLPYKRGLFGCLGFNAAIAEISGGLNSLSRR